ncbi:molecular chaperone [Glaesserella parasuis]|uniref:TorD/DmsD family molecular chaperone n=1 Tax=Glaesserella parasuis TaxID=738 RepID=UPI00094FDC9D|nr:molecular chaperone [Glaesserella parasuis]MDG6264263.1 molecular chaperone [Glaesserella parasuis]MDG6285287.1 molecular chaperone [Glaesserella parasuis]MDG6287380.1 molecular chaperone [Glaesserella parasuis]MDG6289478.1 molecular chaperone [Glaesserella parasuis]MDG6306290.1 molecular chaperone [Glaesserella parasuis]
MNQTTINDFSLLCRLFGNLFYRSPTDPILAGTFAWLKQGNLRQTWALTTDEQSEAALTTVEKNANPTEQADSYQALFAENGAIATTISAYGLSVADFVAFRQQRGMPELANPDHVALLLLTASWIEDNLNSTEAQRDFFEHFVLPCLSKFLGKVEAFDTGFYKALAQLTRDALSAMVDELEELENI